MNKNVKTVDIVRERERESYTLVTKSAVLFNSLTHTVCLENKKGMVINRKKIVIKA